MSELVIEIPKFITHVQLSESRKAKYYTTPDGEVKLKNPHTVGTPKLQKITNQFIYSSSHHSIRDKVVSEMKLFISKHLKDIPPITSFPVEIECEFHAPRNFGSGVRSRNGEIYWLPPRRALKARWDIGNQYIWSKCFDDVIVDEGIIPDDNISYVHKTGGIKYIECETFEERKLVFTIKYP